MRSKRANLSCFEHELKAIGVFEDILLVCMCFRCVKMSFHLSEVLMDLAYANSFFKAV